MDNGTRDELLSRLAEAVGSVTIAHPTRVAVDGPPAAGKTTLADELAVVLRAQDREVIRASIEGFLFPASRRYRRGVYSGEACHQDSLDYDALRRVLLDPLGPGGDRRFRHAVYDGSAAEVERRFRNRYLPSQQLYFATARPTDHADIIVHNDEPRRPAWQG